MITVVIAGIVALALIPVYLRKKIDTDYCVPDKTHDKLSRAVVTLVDADEFGFNKANTPITLRLSCPVLDVNNYTILIDGNKSVENTSNSTSTITINDGLDNAQVLVSLFALDIYGLPIFISFNLYMGEIAMPVHVYHSNGTRAVGVNVQATITDSVNVIQTGLTDEHGSIIFRNVPPRILSIFAYSQDNQIGLSGVAASTDVVSLTLIPFTDTSSDNRNWTYTSQNKIVGNESQWVNVSTNFQSTVQTVSRTFSSERGASLVYIKYQFVTEEIPSGYFGSKYNDYFSVTLRSSKGHYITETNSMNALGLGAFNASGATDWRKLTLPVDTEPEIIRFDLGVSNVIDVFRQSQLNVNVYGSDLCSECEVDCNKCNSDVMCQTDCLNPPQQSCSFYVECMEKKTPCGSEGYALGYGHQYCVKFSNTINRFTPKGQRWMWNTMNCLQKALVQPLQRCERNCQTLRELAFDSHPKCYVDNGVCDLSVFDWIALVTIVGADLLNKDGFIQALKTSVNCIPGLLLDCAVILATPGIPIATSIVVHILKTYLESLL